MDSGEDAVGAVMRLRPDLVLMDVGLSGKVLRFLPPVAGLARGTVTFDGESQMRARPLAHLLARVVEAGVTQQPEGRPDDAILWMKDLGPRVFYGG